MGFLRQIAEYLYIRKKDPDKPASGWIRYMNGINRISLFMFIIGIIIILVRFLFKKQ